MSKDNRSEVDSSNSSLQRAISALDAMGKEQGFLTYSQINEQLPDDGVNAEVIDSVIAAMTVPVLDEPHWALRKGNRRVIKTARTVDSINEAARAGMRPLLKPVHPSERVHFMIAVFQNPETGEIQVSGDARYPPDGVRVIDYTYYYPYHFPNPFAAYLLPPDLIEGEQVWLEDLIEDVVSVWGNQGHHPRLESVVAVWNGRDFEIQFDPDSDAPQWIG